MKTQGGKFLTVFLSSEVIGFGVGIPIALIYGLVMSPVYINEGVYFQALLKYASAVGFIIVVGIAVPMNFLISTGIARFINRFYNHDTNNADILRFFKKITRLPFLHSSLIFLRIAVGAAIVGILVQNELHSPVYTTLSIILLAIQGAFLASIIAYIFVLKIIRKIVLEIVNGGFIPDEVIMKKRSYGIPLFLRMAIFIISPVLIETIDLILIFNVITKANISSSILMSRLTIMVSMNFVLISALTFLFYTQIRSSLQSITQSMMGFLSESGDLTRNINTTLEDDISFVAFLYNKISKNISVLIKEVKMKSGDVADKIANIFSPLTMSVESSNTTREDSKNIIIKTAEQKKLVQSSIINTENLQVNINNLGNFALDFNDSLKSLLKNIDSMIEKILQLKDHSRESLNVIEMGIQNVNSIEEHLNAIGNANTTVRNTAGEISTFIGIIEDIANQTNILSMNASIEASHAGHFGKGFSVVAKEIKKLANESRDKARNITNQMKNLIADIEINSTTSTTAINEIKSNLDVFEKVRKFYKILNEFFEEQSASASDLKKEISAILDKMNRLIRLVEEQQKFVSGTAENIKKVGSSSDEINSYIEKMSSHLESLSLNISESMGSLQEAQKLDKELLEKFNQFKIE